MADAAKPVKADKKPPDKPRLSRFQQLNQIYSLPAPVRTFPLPTFVPHNPISLLHIIYTWISQTISPPSSHPQTLYQAWFSPQTRSVHVTDQKTIRALWEQGFYGKGTLSRSEPSWLDREKKRRGAAANATSEEHTGQRRAQRQQMKWERARKERENIEEQLLKEQKILKKPSQVVVNEDLVSGIGVIVAPVGPVELLALPNSAKDLVSSLNNAAHNSVQQVNGNSPIHGDGQVDTAEHTINGIAETQGLNSPDTIDNPRTNAALTDNSADIPVNIINGNGTSTEGEDQSDPPALVNGEGHANGTELTNGDSDVSKPLKRRKSVRFSPTVEQTTYIKSDPPSPDLAATRTKADEPAPAIEDMEHLQLMMEEALFLTYGLGVLSVLNPDTKQSYSNIELFNLFRSATPFSSPELLLPSPDDFFLISYVVYHHFRSLGWVVRNGIKFGVDWLLYVRGPVFSHAEFAVIIIPSYSDPYWRSDAATRAYVEKKQTRKWSWLHCVNRVNAQVVKTLVLVYVDIPPPVEARAEEALGITGVLRRYRVREFVVKRWSSNRDRD